MLFASSPALAVPAPKLNWKPCADQEGFECGTARVPLRYRHPKRGEIELAVIRHRATDPAHRIGTLSYEGGPGDRGTTQLPGFFERAGTAVQARFDFVSWDPRGVGASTAVHCFATEEEQNRYLQGIAPGETFPVGEAETATWIQRWRRVGRLCQQRNGALLRHVSTADTARDLNLLRRAIGERRLNYVGASYGTLLGATYANLFPDRVRAMVLDGNLSPRAWGRRREQANGGRFLSTYLREHVDQGSADILTAFLDLCGRSGTDRCAFSAGSEEATRDKFAALIQRLRDQPAGAAVTYAQLVSTTAGALYDPSGWPEFARVLQDIWNTGDSHRRLPEPSPFRTPPAASGPEPASTESARGTPLPYDGRMQTLAIVCSESPNPRPAAFGALDAFAFDRSGDVGRYWSWITEPCASWPATAPDRYAGPWDRRTANPVVVVGNTHDPATPHRNAVAMSRQLGRARLLTLDGYGHTSGADPSACIVSALRAYLLELTLPPRGTVCQPERLPFDPGFGEPIP